MTLRNPPSWLQAGSHPAENDRLIITGLVANGGVTGSSTSFQVTASSPASMIVNVGIGSAFVPGTARANQGTYHCFNDSSVAVTLTGSNPALPRIDLVILRVYDSDVQGTQNMCALETVTGTAASTPVAPSVPANSIVLAQIAVGTNVTSISASNITDRRARATTYGGIVPVATSAERDALQYKYRGLIVDNFQTGGLEKYNGASFVSISGAWQDYTPTWRNGTGAATPLAVGNGSLSGRYVISDNKIVTATGRLSRGTTSNAGSTFYSFDLPVQPRDFTQVVGSGWVFASSPAINGACAMRGVNDAASYYQLVAYYNNSIISNSQAITELRWQITYEAA